MAHGLVRGAALWLALHATGATAAAHWEAELRVCDDERDELLAALALELGAPGDDAATVGLVISHRCGAPFVSIRARAMRDPNRVAERALAVAEVPSRLRARTIALAAGALVRRVRAAGRASPAPVLEILTLVPEDTGEPPALPSVVPTPDGAAPACCRIDLGGELRWLVRGSLFRGARATFGWRALRVDGAFETSHERSEAAEAQLRLGTLGLGAGAVLWQGPRGELRMGALFELGRLRLRASSRLDDFVGTTLRRRFMAGRTVLGGHYALRGRWRLGLALSAGFAWSVTAEALGQTLARVNGPFVGMTASLGWGPSRRILGG